MSLVQLDRRNPRQVMINRATKKELPLKTGKPMFYQYIQRMAVGPNATPMNKIMYKLQFSVTEEEYALRSYRTTPEGQLLSVENLFDGSLGYRVRCCAARRDAKSMSESEWVVVDTKWPVNIFIKVNGSPVFVRRQSHNGKDLPVSITELIQVGVNRVEVAIPEESHKSGPRPNYFFGVEVIETAHCNRTVEIIKKFGVHDASISINKINARLQTTASEEEDEFAVLQDSISVDLADPFSAKIFRIPVRGVQCQHIECFDLFNWLNTRPPSAPPKTNCQHQFDCQCPRSQEPTLPDKWRCPICSKDARPSSLRIDKFLVDVRAGLKESGKLDKVKSILVGLDGKWEPVAVVDDDAEGNDKEDEAGVAGGKRKADGTLAEQPPAQKLVRTASDPNVAMTSARRTVSAALPARVIDIIEIDD
ncbi:hypothetical protein SCUCBS95973_007005 [Sporothrix curviconia]|uniref:SP-RING-type domain-containing protein n=1 Tax=Sporothrix curviconia TaxID=1260050 RepID=A0ABP0CA72_9PEZI